LFPIEHELIKGGADPRILNFIDQTPMQVVEDRFEAIDDALTQQLKPFSEASTL